MRRITLLFTIVAGLMNGWSACYAQPAGYIYDESKVPQYILPDVLGPANGKPIKTAGDWERFKRPELLKAFEQSVFGKTMAGAGPLKYEVVSVNKNALNGLATRKEVKIFISNASSGRTLNLLIYTPNKIKKPVPFFLGLNFDGNQGVHPDTGITITRYWTRYENQPGFDNGYANEQSRGKSQERWQLELLLNRGYGLATAYCGDLQWDRKDIASLPDDFNKWYRAGQEIRLDSSSWGTIGIWAWGLSRMLDYLETDKQADAKKVAVIGHSRLGKTALWAAAQDQRFAMVISNNSGESGAAITRRKFGETIKRINTSFPHWFSDNYKKFNDREDALPVDFHQLMALAAPRPLYVASASEDLWADPRGEYLSLFHAGPVYRLYGLDTLTAPASPSVGVPVRAGVLGYHIRKGKHDIAKFDWENYLDFADKHLK